MWACPFNAYTCEREHASCDENIPIGGSSDWLLCGLNSGTCGDPPACCCSMGYEPDAGGVCQKCSTNYCCCSTGYEADAEGACQQCSSDSEVIGSSQCDSGLEISGSDGWLACGANSYTCSKHCCCSTGYEAALDGSCVRCEDGTPTTDPYSEDAFDSYSSYSTDLFDPIESMHCEDRPPLTGSHSWWWCVENSHTCQNYCCCNPGYNAAEDGTCARCRNAADNCEDGTPIAGTDGWFCVAHAHACGEACCCDTGYEADAEGACRECRTEAEKAACDSGELLPGSASWALACWMQSNTIACGSGCCCTPGHEWFYTAEACPTPQHA